MNTSNPSPQAQTARAWIQAYESLDAEAIISLMTDDYEHHFLPRSLGSPVPLTKEQYSGHVKNMVQDTFSTLKLEVIDWVEAPGKIVIQGESKGTLKTGEEYGNQYIWILHFDSTTGNPKINVVKDFMDSLYTKEFNWPQKKGAMEGES